ncbi:MAG: tetratricopeptide repeat protein [Planctomycetota bacterium]
MGLFAPLAAAFWSRRAARHRRRGDLDAARRCAERSRDARPSHPTGWFALGMVALSEGRTEAAGEAFAKASELAPDNAAGWLFRGVAALDAGDRADARAAFNRCREVGGPNAVREAYEALLDVCADPAGATAWPAALGPGLPGAAHLRARVLMAAEARLKAVERPEQWAEGYLDAVFAE